MTSMMRERIEMLFKLHAKKAKDIPANFLEAPLEPSVLTLVTMDVLNAFTACGIDLQEKNIPPEDYIAPFADYAQTVMQILQNNKE